MYNSNAMCQLWIPAAHCLQQPVGVQYHLFTKIIVNGDFDGGQTSQEVASLALDCSPSMSFISNFLSTHRPVTIYNLFKWL